MSSLPRVGDLEIEQDLDFERKSWQVERAGWALMALLMLAALIGLFGRGPLSHAQAAGPGVRLQYERFARYDTETMLEIEMQPQTGDAGKVQFWLDGGYSEQVQIDSLSPEPNDRRFVEDGVIYEFAADEQAQSFKVTLNLRPAQAGALTGKIGPDSQHAVAFTQFVYP